MKINDIRQIISDKLSQETHEFWGDILTHTNPANYGTEVDSVSVEMMGIWVDVPNHTFTFKNLDLNFFAQLAASSSKHGYNENFRFNLSGNGSFSFKKGSQDIEIETIDIDENEELELYGDSSSRVD